ncbi:hypothetical protein TNCV_4702021 [Trichonephila clavipes]|uniref:Uncharacterized protein n=1 Tax=Trichonephila clavipes TaxID=2585209 RepID=A0A8X6WJ11_TRICX|nr:hypothetical protein TNCV_4702021 [Trichonephila clavipes]
MTARGLSFGAQRGANMIAHEVPQSEPPFPSRPPRKVRSLISKQFTDVRGCFCALPGAALKDRRRGQFSRDQSSRPPSDVPRATLCFELMTAASRLLNEYAQLLFLNGTSDSGFYMSCSPIAHVF